MLKLEEKVVLLTLSCTFPDMINAENKIYSYIFNIP